MNNVIVFQIVASERWSNVVFGLAWVVVIAIDAVYLRYAARAMRELKHTGNRRAELQNAASTLVEIAISQFSYVLGRMIADDPYDRRAPNVPPDATTTQSGMIATFLLIVVLCNGILSFITFTEPPLRLGVSPTNVMLLYRLPCRDRSIPINSITKVDLVRSSGSKGSTRPYHVLLIYHDGKSIRIKGDESIAPDQDKTQLMAAYESIRAKVQRGGSSN